MSKQSIKLPHITYIYFDNCHKEFVAPKSNPCHKYVMHETCHVRKMQVVRILLF